MSAYLKVQDRKDVVRDGSSKAILNIDSAGLAAYKAKRERERKIDSLDEVVSSMQSDIRELRVLLTKYLESK